MKEEEEREGEREGERGRNKSESLKRAKFKNLKNKGEKNV
jgi:hypothetical protein